MVEIAFDNTFIREVCEKKLAGESELGTVVAKALRGRLADIMAADNMSGIAAGNPILRAKELAVSVSDEVRLVFAANHHNTPALQDGSVEWAKVTRAKLLRIERTNAKTDV